MKSYLSGLYKGAKLEATQADDSLEFTSKVEKKYKAAQVVEYGLQVRPFSQPVWSGGCEVHLWAPDVVIHRAMSVPCARRGVLRGISQSVAALIPCWSHNLADYQRASGLHQVGPVSREALCC